MRLILDCDGVLLNWPKGFAKFFCELRGLPLPKGEPDSFDMVGWLGRPFEEILPAIMEFNSGQVAAFGQLEPMPGAVQAVTQLHNLGWDLRVATSMSDAHEAEALRLQNLHADFGPVFSEVICLPMGACKKAALSQLEAGIFVDDLGLNVRAGIEAGHRGLLMDLLHNSTETGLDRVSGWSEILDICLNHNEPGILAGMEIN